MYKQELLLILSPLAVNSAVIAKSATKEDLRLVANIGLPTDTLFFIFRIASASLQTGAMPILNNVEGVTNIVDGMLDTLNGATNNVDGRPVWLWGRVPGWGKNLRECA